MGAIDTEAKAYLSSPDKVADAFNYWMYDGKAVIKPEDLRPLDTTAVALPFGKGRKQPLQKIRDVLKLYTAMMDNDACYIILGLEIQASVHYAMPVRNMLYDAMGYAQQVSDLIAKHKENGTKLSGSEYLSGLRKEDRLLPIVTLVISLSTKDWDGSTSIHEMLSVKNKEILSFVPNYKINLLSPTKIQDSEFEKFHTDLGTVMQFIKHRDDTDIDWMEGNDRFRNMERSTASFINTVTGARIQFKEEGDVINMWAAWENGINKARIAGEKNGVQKGEDNMMTAIRMIREDKSAEAIRKATGISSKRLRELRSIL